MNFNSNYQKTLTRIFQRKIFLRLLK